MMGSKETQSDIKIIILIINGKYFKTDRDKHGTQDIVPNYSKRQQTSFKTRFNPVL